MNYFLTPEQQDTLDNWLDDQNKIACESQLNDDKIPEIHKKTLLEERERGLEVPIHNHGYGYYSVSFTPTRFGTRIYAHHHVTGNSFKIYDLDDADEGLLVSRDENFEMNDLFYQRTSTDS
jgi:hypothetical protein